MDSIFKIYFQNGEFIDTKTSFLGVSFDSIFQAIITVFIFAAGYGINQITEYFKERKRLKELEEYIINLIELLELPLTKQKDTLIDFTKKLKEKKEQHYTLVEITSFQPRLLTEINNNDLYTIFVKNKKGRIEKKTELFAQLRGKLFFIDRIKKTLPISFLELANKLESYVLIYKENIKPTDDEFSRLITQNNNQGLEIDNLINEIDDIRYKWTLLPDFQDINISYENYILPLKEICIKYIRDTRIELIKKHTYECIYAYKNIEEVKYFFRKKFLIDARGLQTSMIELKKTLKEFEKF